MLNLCNTSLMPTGKATSPAKRPDWIRRGSLNAPMSIRKHVNSTVLCTQTSQARLPPRAAAAVGTDDDASSSSNNNSFSKPSVTSRAAATSAAFATLGFCVLSDEVPLMRLLVLTYAVWSIGEWIIHRYFMHARAGSFGDRLTPLNKLHVEHHKDTNKDMTLREDNDINALYFHYPNTAIQVLSGVAILAALDATFSLDIPFEWTLGSSVLFAITHNLLWNTMHMDMHEVHEDLQDGLPCISYQRSHPFIQKYVQWMFDNHTTHHDVGGGWNYNVVCPGPDFILGTYMERSQNVKL